MAAVFTKNDAFWIFAWEGGVGQGQDPKIRDLRKNLHRIGYLKH